MANTREKRNGYVITRRRFIPDELIRLSDDQIYEVSEDLVLSAWTSIKPRKDLYAGISAYYPKLGFKLSRLYDSDYHPLYWYCDIIRFSGEGKDLYYEDLLLDVVIRPGGIVRVLDADELADALEEKLIDEATVCLALRQMNDLLTRIREDRLGELQQPVLELEADLFRNEV